MNAFIYVVVTGIGVVLILLLWAACCAVAWLAARVSGWQRRRRIPPPDHPAWRAPAEPAVEQMDRWIALYDDWQHGRG